MGEQNNSPSKIPSLIWDRVKGLNYSVIYPAGNCNFKVNNRNTRTRFEICAKLICKANNMFIFTVNFEHISHTVPVFLLLTLSR